MNLFLLKLDQFLSKMLDLFDEGLTNTLGQSGTEEDDQI